LAPRSARRALVATAAPRGPAAPEVADSPAVTGPYPWLIDAVSLALAAWALVYVALNRLPGRRLLVGVAVLEVLLVGFLVWGLVEMVRDPHSYAHAEFVMYLLACVVIPPAATVWGLGERSRFGTAVLALAFLLMPVMLLRVHQVWTYPSA
jgi:hypothetical protein